jgi:hypothetical protein
MPLGKNLRKTINAKQPADKFNSRSMRTVSESEVRRPIAQLDKQQIVHRIKSQWVAPA